MSQLHSSGRRRVTELDQETCQRLWWIGWDSLGSGRKELIDLDGWNKASAKDDKAVAVSFTMHDFVHALARSQVGGLLAVLDGRDYPYCEEKHCRYALLTSFNATPWKSIPEQLWALHCCSKMEINNDTFSNAKYLGVLDLRKSSMQRLPDAICHLRLLGYLDLSDSNCLRILPESFGNLVNLVYINLSGCYGLLNLPGSFGNLINMLHINLSGCCGLVKLPESFGNLINLMHVNLSECSGLVMLPESSGNLINLVNMDLSGCSGLAQLPQSFGKLQNVKYLDLSSCSCVEGIRSALYGFIHLQHLNLSHPCCYLAEHRLHLMKLKDVWGQLRELRHLNLSMFLDHIFYYLQEEERLQYIGSISGLSSLEYLDLSHNTLLFELPESLGNLSGLHTLDLSGCIRLKRITRTIGAMECLRSIVVSNCRGLETLSFVVHVDNEAYSSNLVQLEDVMSCKELEISCLEKVKSLEEAKIIKLAEKQSLEKLRLDWTVGSHASVEDDALLEELVPPNSLRCFELHGHNGRNLPVWLGKAISSHLPNLVEVTMEDISKCSDLPPFGLLPDLKRLALRRMHSITRIHAGDLCGGKRAAFHRFSELILDDMQNLREFNTIYYSGDEKYMFPAIDVLMIQKCSKLRFQPSMPRAKMLLSTREKPMSSSVNGQGEEHGVEEGPLSPTPSDSAPVTELQVEAVRLAELNWSLLCHLPPLHSLHISKCNDITTYAEIMPFLSSLQVLLLSHCETLISLPNWLGKSISSNLPNLEILTMEDIPACNDLPPLGVLPNLKRLVLRRMANIRRIDAGDLSRHYRASFRRLSHFTLDDMESLEEFNTLYYSGGEEFMFPVIDELVILKCRKLRFGPRTPRVKLLLISACGQLMLPATVNKRGGQKHHVEGTSSRTSTASSAPVTEMMVEAISLAKVKPTLLCHLPPLYTLHIKNCVDMTTLPKIMPFLSSIKSLCFSQRDRLISLPEWLGKNIYFHLPNLVEVTMEDISWCSDLPPFGLLPELKQLVLRRMNSITKIDAGDLCGHSRVPFRQLVRFTVEDMAGLQEINTTYNSGDEKCMLPTIKEMVIQKCNRLRFQLRRPRAKMLLIYGCDLLMLSSLYRGRHGMAEGSSGSTLASLAPLTELMVETVPLAKLNWTLLHDLPPLHSLHMSNYNDLTTSTEIMPILSCLKSLFLSDCKSLISVPETLGKSISSHFPNLREVTMEDIPGCSDLPLLGLLPGLQRLVLRRMPRIQKIDARDLSGGPKVAFEQLSQFILDDMENLEEFNTRYRSDVADSFMLFPDIEELVILRCPKLRFRPSRPRTKMLLISACDQLTTSSEHGERYDVDECPASSTWATSSAVTELVVEDFTKPLDKLNWNLLFSQELPLHRLHIKKCDDLGDPSRKEKIMNVLCSLKSLCFSDCKGLTSLPEYFEKFTSLEELVINKCHSITSLQSSGIDKLINLKCLCINDCPKLKTWCESMEDKKKLPNISMKYLNE